jgi:hypothetical protein
VDADNLGGHSLLIFIAEHNCGAVERRFSEQATKGLRSAGRSLILFICNVVQIILMFSIWYQLEAGPAKGDALFQSLLVFAKLGYPKHLEVLVGMQIATDFLLLAIFLAHQVGRVGMPTATSLTIVGGDPLGLVA